VGYWLGLDIGTTFSAAAVATDGRVEIVSLGNHTAAIPSLLFLKDDGTFLVGEAAGRRGLAEPERLARHFKRRFGDSTPLLLGGTPWSADALLSRLAKHLVEAVAAQRGAPPDAVAVTHPANWGPFKIDLLRQALRQAGLHDARLLTEPEAAATYYASTERVEPGEVVAIYDLGGGTFDAAVLRKSDNGFDLLGEPEGIERLGGIDFDEAVMAHVAGFIGPELAQLDLTDPATLSATARLREDCVEAKEALSADTDVAIPVMLPSIQTELRLTRAEFETMIRPTLAETTAALGRALRSSGVATAEVKAVLLVGGSSRIPLVGQLVGAEIGRPVAVDVHPKHAVAMGAALASAPGGPPTAAAAVPAAPAAAAVAPAPPAPAAPAAPPAPAPPAPAPPAPAPPAPAQAPEPPTAGPPRGGRRRPLIVAASVATVVVIVAAVLVLTRHKKPAPNPVAHPDAPTFVVPVSVGALASGAGALWLGANGGPTVSRFDVSTRLVTGNVALGAFSGNTAVAFGAGAVWAINDASPDLARIDPATNTITATFHIGQAPHAVMVANGAVWVTSPMDGIVMRVDPVSGATTPIHVRGQPTNLAFGATTVWVTDPANSDIARIDPATNQVAGDARSGRCPDYIAADDTMVWVQDECQTTTVFKVDPATGNVVGSAQVGRDAKWLILANGALWVANATDATVSKVDVTALRTVATIRVGLSPGAVTVAGNDVWVANSGDQTLSVLSGR
jgi:DNA-binding beta-propeller fold protein YncE/actin-like ATPase involved in cell morphogenesis